MIPVFSQSLVVPASAIDAYRHVNNIAYVQWMQDVGIAHINALGWSMQRSLDAGVAWVARSHFIEYLRPAFEGEPITIHTWLTSLSDRSCPRRYLFLRDTDKKPLVRAETVWVSVDPTNGRSIRIPDVMRDSFPLMSSDALVAESLGIPPFRDA